MNFAALPLSKDCHGGGALTKFNETLFVLAGWSGWTTQFPFTFEHNNNVEYLYNDTWHLHSRMSPILENGLRLYQTAIGINASLFLFGKFCDRYLQFLFL